ncbi:AlpA family phage regulatory protein [Bradyrhizobium sp. 168]|jgi:prophage regulatory protein|uniref:helix-turn-helix transcriptional regulator n=1 Tax=unclassified Bradyrhizobium TaxID=2631580 RepID=UPI00036E2694|nr:MULTISPECIES: AlpA family phage regulatory protein [unclassified Bradyrhizobium]MCK1349402.1 AlpA family phage regulatory protein [Bradyrhizobium sp. CW11]MCK1473163.1 AlpA family phage regulatory protein [Bradyrhizobium sp. CW10]MCK1584139.1 AlpA family phage regulatory protein [Bradyrhizobium sp. 168]MCK1590348.1 AlpA family phage regulatory protein [Bradyrhizobium sp. 169]MCK1701858.1 AlpA family phage regulatory protein [Bradyrhizobium sp. 146]
MRKPKLVPFPNLNERGVLLGRRQIDRLEAQGKFPKRVPIGANRVGWVTDEVDDWVSAAIARRSRNLAAQALAERVA